MDTKQFQDLTSSSYKDQTRANWTEAPCGSNYSDKECLTKEYFEDIESHRYKSHPWILESIRNFDIKNRSVLEIGYGMGTDHLSMARQGAVMNGIDLTHRNLEVTTKRFEMYGFRSNLTVGDAENLPYDDESFDFIYSFGVVHHTPDTEKAIREIHRVLKPGGKCYITVYHKNSIFFWWSTYVFNYILKSGYKKRSLRQQLSLIEYPNTNENMVIRLYGRREFERLFSAFGDKRSYIRQLIPVDIAYFSRFFSDPYRPTSVLGHLGKIFGWYVIVEAEK